MLPDGRCCDTRPGLFLFGLSALGSKVQPWICCCSCFFFKTSNCFDLDSKKAELLRWKLSHFCFCSSVSSASATFGASADAMMAFTASGPMRRDCRRAAACWACCRSWFAMLFRIFDDSVGRARTSTCEFIPETETRALELLARLCREAAATTGSLRVASGSRPCKELLLAAACATTEFCRSRISFFCFFSASSRAWMGPVAVMASRGRRLAGWQGPPFQCLGAGL
mmetsp:Transcript_81041/g.153787  ORF Transcript_81041/g.153787 Transcript_81041/m.153787 type:complete len:226 (-) Transcript_81041:66-743(-)